MLNAKGMVITQWAYQGASSDGVYNNMEALDYLWGKTFAEFDTGEFIKQFDRPTLLLLSDYDFLVAPTKLWEPIISGKPVQLHKFQQSAHNPMLEQPEEYALVLKQFIGLNSTQ